MHSHYSATNTRTSRVTTTFAYASPPASVHNFPHLSISLSVPFSHSLTHARTHSLARSLALHRAGLAEEFIDKIPDERDAYMPYVEDAMRRVKLHFDSERKIFMESADRERGVQHDSMGGRLFNPGHSIEVSWFLLHLCNLKPDAAVEEMALAALGGALEIGWDKEVPAGGILYVYALSPFCKIACRNLFLPFLQVLC